MASIVSSGEDTKSSPGRSLSPDSGVSSPSSSNSSLFGSPEAQSRYYASLVNYGPGIFGSNGDLLRMYETAAASIGLKNSVIQSNVLQAITLGSDPYLRPHENLRLSLSPPNAEKTEAKEDSKSDPDNEDKESGVTEETSSPKSGLNDSGIYHRISSTGNSPSFDGLPEPAHLPLRYTCSESSLPLLRPVDLSIIQTSPKENKEVQNDSEEIDARKDLFTVASIPPLEIKTDYNSSSDSGRDSVSPRCESPKCLKESPCEGVKAVLEKPPLSYIAMISMAILSTPERKMILGDIYSYISDKFPYYNNSSRSWRNSVRHNLSLNECFVKAGRASNAKGFYWGIHPACVEDFAKGDFRRRQARRRARRSALDLSVSNLNAVSFDMHGGGEKGYIPMSSAPMHSYHHLNSKYHPYSRPMRPVPTSPPNFYSYAPGFAPPAPPAQAPPVTWYQSASLSGHHLLAPPVTTMAGHPMLPDSQNLYYPHLAHVSSVNLGSLSHL